MTDRIHRSAVALASGDLLRETGANLAELPLLHPKYRLQAVKAIHLQLQSALTQIDKLIASCRAARQSYPNYPRLRQVIGDAGDSISELRDQLLPIIDSVKLELAGSETDITKWSQPLISLGLQLRLIQFVPAPLVKDRS